MNNEDKKAAFLKKAQDNKENFELHKKLIDESIKPLQKHLGKESIKHFYDTGSVSGGFLLALMDYAEKYADTKVKNFSSNTMLAERYSAIEKIKLARKLKGEEHDKIYEISGASYTSSILHGQMDAYDNCLKWLAE